MNRTRMLVAGGVMLGAAVVLGWIVVVLFGGVTDGMDLSWNALMVASRQPWTLTIAYALNVIGGGWVASFLVPVLILALLVALRRPRAAVYAAVTFFLSVGLTQLFKEIFGRARPDDMLVASDYGSFPSGHTANAATIAVVMFLIFRRRWVAIAGIVWTAAMALSRTLLSVHWLTDTVGGMLVGAASALLVAGLLGRWAFLRRWASLGGTGSRAVVTDPHAVAPEQKESPVSGIRPYRPSDREALYEICVRTADAGAGAVGLFTDDRLWGDIFAAPYAERHPDLTWVVQSADGRTVGYILATDDTEAFEAWFRDEWWPGVAGRYPLSGAAEPTRQDGMIRYASSRGPGREPLAAEYPAHLHIDLLPETQGQGLGRTLIETLFAELRRRSVPGLHLGMNTANTGAGAFYERIGMHLLESNADTTKYGIRLS